jgi:excisionase family DNA binding protein
MGTTIVLPTLALSVQDCADELGVSAQHIRRLISSKQLPASRIGNRIVIKREDLEQLLDANRL